MSCIVEQFGFATIPRWVSSACGLTSATTSGTVGSVRQRDELSTTTAPGVDEARSPLARRGPPAEKMARSKPAIVSACSGATTPTPSSVRPADRAEAKGTISRAGKPRSRSLASMTVPTAPVAPTTATRYP